MLAHIFYQYHLSDPFTTCRYRLPQETTRASDYTQRDVVTREHTYNLLAEFEERMRTKTVKRSRRRRPDAGAGPDLAVFARLRSGSPVTFHFDSMISLDCLIRSQ